MRTTKCSNMKNSYRYVKLNWKTWRSRYLHWLRIDVNQARLHVASRTCCNWTAKRIFLKYHRLRTGKRVVASRITNETNNINCSRIDNDNDNNNNNNIVPQTWADREQRSTEWVRTCGDTGVDGKKRVEIGRQRKYNDDSRAQLLKVHRNEWINTYVISFYTFTFKHTYVIHT